MKWILLSVPFSRWRKFRVVYGIFIAQSHQKGSSKKVAEILITSYQIHFPKSLFPNGCLRYATKRPSCVATIPIHGFFPLFWAPRIPKFLCWSLSKTIGQSGTRDGGKIAFYLTSLNIRNTNILKGNVHAEI